MAIQELLAKRTYFRWTTELRAPISYYEFVKQTHPGDKYDPQVRAARFKLLHNFVGNYGHAIPGLEKTFLDLNTKLKKREIFASFSACVQELKRLDVTTTIVLRTIGKELNEVVDEIKKDFPKANFAFGACRECRIHFKDR